MKYQLLFLSLLSLFAGQTQVQRDSVMLLDGKTFTGSIIANTDQFLTLITEFSIDTSLNKKFKKDSINQPRFVIDTNVSEINVDKYRVFSYFQQGQEVVLYKQDDDIENFLTEDQARKAALGSYDGKNFYNAKPVFYSSAAITFGFCLLDTYMSQARKDAIANNADINTGLFGRSPSIWPIASVLVLPISFAIPSTKVRTKNLMNGIRGDQYYYAGFNSTTRQRRSFAALKGAASGLVLGYASYFIFQKNEF